MRIIGRFAGEREAGEEFGHWMERAGGAAALAESLADLDRFPSPEEDPGFYVDFDEQAPFTAEVGAGECAG